MYASMMNADTMAHFDTGLLTIILIARRLYGDFFIEPFLNGVVH